MVLVSQGKATSHFIYTSIKLYTFLSVQYSLIPPPLLSFKYYKHYFKIHLYSGLLNVVLKTIIICNQFSIICVKVGNIKEKRRKTV